MTTIKQRTPGFRDAIALGMLLLVGLVQMLGDILDVLELRAIGAATGASPAPRVFTAHEGFETYSSRFFIFWHDADGKRRRLMLTPAVYSGLRGPYNRRNAYGAALSYGPVLASNPATRPMFESAFEYALCHDTGVIEELGIAPDRTLPIGVVLEPREANSRDWRWQLDFEITCKGGNQS